MAIDAKTKKALKSALNQTSDYSEIAQILNQDQVISPNGREWTAATVSYHLVNNIGIRKIKKHSKKKPDVAAVKVADETPDSHYRIVAETLRLIYDYMEEDLKRDSYVNRSLLALLFLTVVQLCFIIGLILTIS